jgi:micrococcal nuclease
MNGMRTPNRHGSRARPVSTGRRWSLVLVIATAVLVVVAGAQAGSVAPQATLATVGRVIDGDTISLASGQRVRLVQIDSTELGSGECYSRKAAQALRRLIPEGSSIRLEADPALDQVDRYGRLLRYVWRESTNINVALVREGAATVWFYDGDKGKYAAQLLSAARNAQTARRGMWGACRVLWDPYGPATASPKGPGASQNESSGDGSSGASGLACQRGYRPCLPIVDDLDCADIADSIKPIHVTGDDPYRLDGNGDGLGCQSEISIALPRDLLR